MSGRVSLVRPPRTASVPNRAGLDMSLIGGKFAVLDGILDIVFEFAVGCIVCSLGPGDAGFIRLGGSETGLAGQLRLGRSGRRAAAGADPFGFLDGSGLGGQHALEAHFRPGWGRVAGGVSC